MRSSQYLIILSIAKNVIGEHFRKGNVRVWVSHTPAVMVTIRIGLYVPCKVGALEKVCSLRMNKELNIEHI
jgi:hypothetical protein